MTTPAFLFLLSSARRDGNAERLARMAAAPLSGAARWLRLDDHPLPRFEDRRHMAPGEQGFAAPQGAERDLIEATLAASDLVFVAPVYWYNLPASAKLYLDYWSAWLRAEGYDFKARMAGKSMWAIVSISDDDHAMARPLVESLKLSADYMGMRWRGALLGEGNRPGDVENDARAAAKARVFFSEGSGAT